MKRLRPFFSFYGAKWSIINYYPKPIHGTPLPPDLPMMPALYSAIPTSLEMIEIFRRYDFWRWMVSIYPWPKTILERVPRRYAIDNGAYHFHLKSKKYDDTQFLKILDRFGDGADFVVIPDKVGDARETFEMFHRYRKLLRNHTSYFVLQDGMTPLDLHGIVDDVDGFFVGGTTEWKLRNIGIFSEYAKSRNKRIHVGRVNTIKRIRICRDHGVDSSDGSGFARFRKELIRISEWRLRECKQLNLRWV